MLFPRLTEVEIQKVASSRRLLSYSSFDNSFRIKPMRNHPLEADNKELVSLRKTVIRESILTMTMKR